jgi:hypothetical protein
MTSVPEENKYAADKEKVLKILDEALLEAWEEGYDSGEQNDRFEP